MKMITTTNAPAAIGPYSQAVQSGRLLFLSGQIPLSPETGQLAAGGIAEQTKQVVDNIKAVLTEAGVGLESVVKTTCYLKSMDDFADFNEVYGKHFTHKPARSCIAAALPRNALVEIEVIAEL